jgi:hypothetical protein
MNDSAVQVLIDHLETAPPDSAALSIARLASSDEPILLLVAALLGTAPTRPFARATRLARTTRDRQLVAICAAHLAGDHARARELIREHLSDHPNHPIVAWIATNDDTVPYEVPGGTGITGWLRWRT